MGATARTAGAAGGAVHRTPPVITFRSGASAPADFRGYAAARVPVGVAVSAFGPDGATWGMVAAYARSGGAVFVDSGAFGDFTAGRATDFDLVMRRYRQLAREAGGGRLHLVMPDVLGDQAASLALLRRHAAAIRALVAQGHDALVPLHKGPLPPSAAWREAVRLLGTDDLTAAVPALENAFGQADLAELLSAPAAPKRIHLLGIGGAKRTLAALVRTIHARGPAITVTSDANRLRAKIGTGRPVTVEARRRGAEIPLWDGTHPGLRRFDATELVGAVALDKAWLTADQVRTLAAALGVTHPEEQERWICAHREEGLSVLLDEADGDGRATEWAVLEMWRPQAERAARAAARSAAIAAVEVDDARQLDLFAAPERAPLAVPAAGAGAPVTMAAPRRLLVLGCSATKDHAAGNIPAVDRYRPGAYFQMLHSMPRATWPDVVILSAEHGFLDSGTPIADYDRRMDKQRAGEMLRDAAVLDGLRRITAGQHFADILVAAGTAYRPVIEAALDRAGLAGRARFASGGIGAQRGQIGRWLRGHADPDGPAPSNREVHHAAGSFMAAAA